MNPLPPGPRVRPSLRQGLHSEEGGASKAFTRRSSSCLLAPDERVATRHGCGPFLSATNRSRGCCVERSSQAPIEDEVSVLASLGNGIRDKKKEAEVLFERASPRAKGIITYRFSEPKPRVLGWRRQRHCSRTVGKPLPRRMHIRHLGGDFTPRGGSNVSTPRWRSERTGVSGSSPHGQSLLGFTETVRDLFRTHRQREVRRGSLPPPSSVPCGPLDGLLCGF